MSYQLLISEVYPNPDTGNEWIELLLINPENELVKLLNFTFFDSSREIFKFSNEQFIDQLLVVEVTGLNNDQDSVILKDNLGNIIDSHHYSSTQKGLSWSRNSSSNEFLLTNPSRNLINPVPISTPTSTLTPKPSPIYSISPSISQPTSNQTQIKNDNKNASQVKITQYPYYDLDNIQLQAIEMERERRLSKLVLVGQKNSTGEFRNAIIGSLLLILGALSLLYAKFKKN